MTTSHLVWGDEGLQLVLSRKQDWIGWWKWTEWLFDKPGHKTKQTKKHDSSLRNPTESSCWKVQGLDLFTREKIRHELLTWRRVRVSIVPHCQTMDVLMQVQPTSPRSPAYTDILTHRQTERLNFQTEENASEMPHVIVRTLWGRRDRPITNWISMEMWCH